MKIHFEGMREKFPLLSEKDIFKIEEYFSSPDTQEKLTKLEKKRKFIGVFFFLAVFLGIGVLGYLFKFTTFLQSEGGIKMTLFAGVLIYSGFYAWFKRLAKSLKSSVLYEILKQLDQNLIYGPDIDSYLKNGGKSSYTTLQSLHVQTCLHAGLLQSYSRYIGPEDVMSYEVKDQQGNALIEISGFEFSTTETRGSGKNRRTVTTNHCYLSNIKFLHPRRLIKAPILILRDREKTFLSSLFGGFGRKNKVQLENPIFEENFDVFCDDQIEARMLLTPSFMERLVNYADKVSKDRIYEFYFFDNSFYIKYELRRGLSSTGQFLEFSPWKSFEANFLGYLEFIQELKYLKSLALDLKLAYYDQISFSTQTIPPTNVGPSV